MMTRRSGIRRLGTALLGLTAFAAVAGASRPAFAQKPPFTFTKIQYPGSTYTDAAGINNAGLVVGTYIDGAGLYHGYTFDGSTYTTVDYPGAVESYLLGVGPAGQLLGSWAPAAAGPYHAFSRDSGVFTSFDYPGAESDGRSANAAGQIVGTYYAGVGTPVHGFLKVGDTYTALDYPGSQATATFGINDGGKISGTYLDSGGVQRGFTYAGGTYTPVNFPGASETAVNGLNSAGTVVGRHKQGSSFHGFVNIGGTSFRSFDADFAGTTYTAGVAINDSNRIVGVYVAPDCPGVCGFLATPAVGPTATCDQTFTKSYSGTTLTLNFTLRTGVPTTWGVLLYALNTIIPLWTVSIPALPTTTPWSLPIPNVPRIGTVFGLSTLSTATLGVVCADIAQVNTGTP